MLLCSSTVLPRLHEMGSLCKITHPTELLGRLTGKNVNTVATLSMSTAFRLSAARTAPGVLVCVTAALSAVRRNRVLRSPMPQFTRAHAWKTGQARSGPQQGSLKLSGRGHTRFRGHQWASAPEGTAVCGQGLLRPPHPSDGTAHDSAPATGQTPQGPVGLELTVFLSTARPGRGQ